MIILRLFKRWISRRSFSSMLESHILSGNPKSVYDVERLTKEFEFKLSRGEI